jgi:hypothetical protein
MSSTMGVSRCRRVKATEKKWLNTISAVKIKQPGINHCWGSGGGGQWGVERQS